MKKSIYILFLTFIFSASISVEEAQNVAENFFFSKNDQRNSSFDIASIENYNYNNNDVFYIFNLENSGFILISADNLISPVLGYSFENNYISYDIPSNINYLFNLYSNELENQKLINRTDQEIINLWDKYSQPVDYEGQSRGVSPLLSARFDQGTPWNDDCPEDSDGSGGNVLVGCVAVSMAQIMHYWSYPEVGYGSHGYNHWEYGYQYADFSSAFYDYSNMPANYATEETQELLFHAGVAVNMGYGTDGSGAQVFGGNPSAYYAMRNYFLFKNDMNQVYPDNYSESQYRSILQEQLNNNKPMIYVGYSNDGGHAWNIDGYDDNYFHNNWGWGGSQNGYFLLSSLNGFDSSQGAIINMEPQSLNNPNVMLDSYTYQETIGDGDLVVNPGETIDLFVTVENLIPWNDATNIDMILSTQDEDLTILNDYITFSNLDAGESYINYSEPFSIEFSNDISFSNHQLQLNILSFGSNGEYSENEFYIDVDVSLNQNGFPYLLTLTDDNGDDYNAATIVQSSPLITDINSDGYQEMFFGDDGGYFHGVDYLGNPLPGFPIQLEGTSSEIWGSPASADIDNDGELEFVITSKNKHCYIIDEYGNIELDYETDQFLMATPSLGNLDNDTDLEIIFFGYTSSGDVFAINHDGTNVENFPVEINEKVLKGGAIYDIDNNGRDDIVVATENDKSIFVIYDNGDFENIFTSNDKFKSAPSIIDNNGDITILAGDEGGILYAVSPSGEFKFSIITGDNVRCAASFISNEYISGIFFGSEDGNLYGIDFNGNNLPNWPQNVAAGISGNATINSSPIFADLDSDGLAEIITATEEGQLIAFKLDGTNYSNFPMQFDFGFISSPSITDIDNDNDLEIVVGTNQNLSVIDFKEIASINNSDWITYRGNNKRSGSFTTSNNFLIGDINSDTFINVQDLVLLINVIIGVSELDNSQTNIADINSDSTIDVLDVVLLVNTILDR